MKLSIDTKEDSHDEIKKAIRMLQAVINEHPVSTNMESTNDDFDLSALNPTPETTTVPETPDMPSPMSNFFDAPTTTEQPEEKEEKKDEDQVIMY